MTLGLFYRSLSVDLPVEVCSRAAATVVSRNNNNNNSSSNNNNNKNKNNNKNNKNHVSIIMSYILLHK